jgi:hypothetical protein
MNASNIVIGNMGNTCNGQHRLVGLILAVQEWEEDHEKFPFWKTEPTIETLVAFGVKEEEKVLRTMNMGKPCEAADIFYRDPEFFPDRKDKERHKLSRMLGYTVRTLWSRLGVAEAHGIQKTDTELDEFRHRHPRILESVDFIFRENGGKDKRISKYLPLGSASGLLYLMGSSTTEPRSYHQADNPSEEILSWDAWEKACEFFVQLAGGNMPEVSKALGRLIDDGDASPKARLAIVSKAWIQFIEGEPITSESLRLSYVV